MSLACLLFGHRVMSIKGDPYCCRCKRWHRYEPVTWINGTTVGRPVWNRDKEGFGIKATENWGRVVPSPSTSEGDTP